MRYSFPFGSDKNKLKKHLLMANKANFASKYPERLIIKKKS